MSFGQPQIIVSASGGDGGGGASLRFSKSILPGQINSQDHAWNMMPETIGQFTTGTAVFASGNPLTADGIVHLVDLTTGVEYDIALTQAMSPTDIREAFNAQLPDANFTAWNFTAGPDINKFQLLCRVNTLHSLKVVASQAAFDLGLTDGTAPSVDDRIIESVSLFDNVVASGGVGDSFTMGIVIPDADNVPVAISCTIAKVPEAEGQIRTYYDFTQLGGGFGLVDGRYYGFAARGNDSSDGVTNHAYFSVFLANGTSPAWFKFATDIAFSPIADHVAAAFGISQAVSASASQVNYGYVSRGLLSSGALVTPNPDFSRILYKIPVGNGLLSGQYTPTAPLAAYGEFVAGPGSYVAARDAYVPATITGAAPDTEAVVPDGLLTLTIGGQDYTMEAASGSTVSGFADELGYAFILHGILAENSGGQVKLTGGYSSFTIKDSPVARALGLTNAEDGDKIVAPGEIPMDDAGSLSVILGTNAYNGTTYTVDYEAGATFGDIMAAFNAADGISGRIAMVDAKATNPFVQPRMVLVAVGPDDSFTIVGNAASQALGLLWQIGIDNFVWYQSGAKIGF